MHLVLPSLEGQIIKIQEVHLPCRAETRACCCRSDASAAAGQWQELLPLLIFQRVSARLLQRLPCAQDNDPGRLLPCYSAGLLRTPCRWGDQLRTAQALLCCCLQAAGCVESHDCCWETAKQQFGTVCLDGGLTHGCYPTHVITRQGHESVTSRQNLNAFDSRFRLPGSKWRPRLYAHVLQAGGAKPLAFPGCLLQTLCLLYTHTSTILLLSLREPSQQ